MSNELVPKDPNQLKIEPSSGEFAKPDKTRQVNAAILGPKQVPDKTSPLPSPFGDACILGFNKNTEGGRGEPEGMLGQ